MEAVWAPGPALSLPESPCSPGGEARISTLLSCRELREVQTANWGLLLGLLLRKLLGGSMWHVVVG